MFYRVWIHTANPQQEITYISDPRGPDEIGAALAAEGYLVARAGEVSFIAYNDGQTTHRSVRFKGSGQVVLLRRYVIRLNEMVIEPGTEVTEE